MPNEAWAAGAAALAPCSVAPLPLAALTKMKKKMMMTMTTMKLKISASGLHIILAAESLAALCSIVPVVSPCLLPHGASGHASLLLLLEAFANLSREPQPSRFTVG